MPKYDGSAKFRIDQKCKTLIDGFLGGYVRKDGDDETPEKDGFYEHLFDALRYGLIVLFNHKTFEVIRQAKIYVRPRMTADSSTGY